MRLLQLLISEPEQAVSQAQALLLSATPDQQETATWSELVNLVEILLVYRLPQFNRQEIRAMLNLMEVDLKKTVFYQEVFAEGRREECVSLVLRQLRRRFGTVDTGQMVRIQRLTLEQAENLAEALLDFQTPADLKAWLAKPESGVS